MGGSGRVGGVKVVDKPGRRLVKGVTSLFVDLIDQRAGEHCHGPREAAQHRPRREQSGDHIAEEVRIRALRDMK